MAILRPCGGDRTRLTGRLVFFICSRLPASLLHRDGQIEGPPDQEHSGNMILP
jgi:hypothetical protein